MGKRGGGSEGVGTHTSMSLSSPVLPSRDQWALPTCRTGLDDQHLGGGALEHAFHSGVMAPYWTNVTSSLVMSEPCPAPKGKTREYGRNFVGSGFKELIR